MKIEATEAVSCFYLFLFRRNYRKLEFPFFLTTSPTTAIAPLLFPIKSFFLFHLSGEPSPLLPVTILWTFLRDGHFEQRARNKRVRRHDAGKEMVDFIADYLGTIRTRRVFPDVKPGYMRDLLPAQAPKCGERWEDVIRDVENVIMPGVWVRLVQCKLWRMHELAARCLNNRKKLHQERNQIGYMKKKNARMTLWSYFWQQCRTNRPLGRIFSINKFNSPFQVKFANMYPTLF